MNAMQLLTVMGATAAYLISLLTFLLHRLKRLVSVACLPFSTSAVLISLLTFLLQRLNRLVRQLPC